MAKIRDIRLSALLLLCMLGAAAADDFTVSAPTTLSRLLITTLRCTTTETRTYLYSSDNRLWGPTGQRFRTTAELHVYCIGAAGGRHGNNALLFGATVNHITEEPIDEPRRRTEFNSGELDAFDAEKDDALSKLASGRFSSPFVSARRKRQIDPSDPYPVDEQFQDPWKFVQGNDGTILEVRFMSSDTDEEARNFKRALTSAFQSQFNPQASQKETTDITGKHFATFSFSTPTSSTSVVSKTYSNSDFTQFAAPSAAHDKDSVDINGAESETFSDGVLFQSSKHSIYGPPLYYTTRHTRACVRCGRACVYVCVCARMPHYQ
ncbi:PREDICTED: uncharacterized protein LOC106811282 [Priapulus caudatus]|uniref:Uncharacterized protein LOC106811282 n=1 Tax=Priapulus caudatus TaxID=37621 RepID=A0ABM1EDR5_PRICU|nr:PREDICTED: uncharacterized protein LOC106811282 [Priapulus caudatus]